MEVWIRKGSNLIKYYDKDEDKPVLSDISSIDIVDGMLVVNNTPGLTFAINEEGFLEVDNV